MTRRHQQSRERPRPHRLAVYWRAGTDAAGRPCCDLLVQAGVVRLNASAARVWALLDGRTDETAVVAALAGGHPDADPDELRAVVSGLLADLERLGALVRDWTPLDPSRAALAPVARP